jgi:O-antigen ligase
LAERGILGEEARSKYEWQSMGDYGVLLGGRSEVLSSVIAIKDSPLLGHGSWAKNCKYTDILMEIKRRLGYVPGAENDDCLIPAHSIILGAWVEAGVLGVILWLWVSFLTVKTLIAVFQKSTKLATLVIFFGFLLLWDLAFSPYGAERRFITTFFVVVLITALNWIQKESNDSQ